MVSGLGSHKYCLLEYTNFLRLCEDILSQTNFDSIPDINFQWYVCDIEAFLVMDTVEIILPGRRNGGLKMWKCCENIMT